MSHNRLIKQGGTVLLTRGANLVTRILLIYVLGKCLTTTEYGVYALILSSITFGTAIVGLSVHTYLARVVPGFNKEKQLETFRTTFTFEVIAAFVIVGVFYFSGALDYCLAVLKMSPYRMEAVLGLLLQVGIVASNETQYYLIAQKRIEVGNVVDYICQSACVWPLLIGWFSGFKLTLFWILAMSCAGAWTATAYGLARSGIFHQSRFILRVDPSILRAALFYSVPLVVVSVSFYGTKLSDRFVLSHYAGLSKVGIYSFTFAFLNMFYSLTSQVIELTIWPYVCEAHDKSEPERASAMLRLGLKWALLVFSAGVGILLLDPDLAVRLLARPEYVGGRPVIAILAVGFLALICGHFASYSFMLKRDTLRLMLADLTGAAIAIVGSILLVPLYSYIGAACATAGALIVSAGLKYIISKGGAFSNLRAFLSFDSERDFIHAATARLRPRAVAEVAEVESDV